MEDDIDASLGASLVHDCNNNINKKNKTKDFNRKNHQSLIHFNRIKLIIQINQIIYDKTI